METQKSKYPVVVIGCGASGIAALSKLKQAGIQAVGVEATSRIGGRINTIDFGDGVLDLGAAWCHGERNNKVFEIANPHGLLGRPEAANTDADWYVFSNGGLMPTGNAATILQCINEQIEGNKDSNKSILEFVRTGVQKGNIKTSVPITRPFLEWFERDNHLGDAESPSKLKSLRATSKLEACEGEFWLNWKGRGYKTLLDVLLGRIPGATPLDVDIQYNKEVTNICWDTSNLDPNDPQPTVLITFKDGSVIIASQVIVTIPLGVLKNNYHSLFTPSLPNEKISAINNLQTFILDKIYIEFQQPWWPKDLMNFRILWQEEDKALFKGEKWVTGIYGLRAVEHKPNVLLAWINGQSAIEMEKVCDDEVQKGILKLLEHVFQLNFDVSAVTKLTRSQWALNEFARGSYSYRSVSTEETNVSAEMLSEPLECKGVPVVCFAGEATSHKWHGNVHGAVDAGFREAERIIKLITN